MPVLLSIVTVLESIFEYNKMPLLLRSTNVAYSKLKKVLFWWTGLTLIQQRMPQNKMQMVAMVESILHERLIILHEGESDLDNVNNISMNNSEGNNAVSLKDDSNNSDNKANSSDHKKDGTNISKNKGR